MLLRCEEEIEMGTETLFLKNYVSELDRAKSKENLR